MNLSKSVLFFFLIAGGFFILPKIGWGAASDMIITEIMYNNQDTDEGHEWLEIHNQGTDSINLTGWKFYEAETNHSLTIKQGDWLMAADGYAVIADNAEQFLLDHPAYNGTLFDSFWGSLSDTGETLAIKETSSGSIINSVTYNDAWGADGNGKTLGLVDGNWQETDPTPGAANSLSAPPEETPPPDEGKQETPPVEPTTTPVKPYVLPRAVLINEIVIDPTDEDTEWIELINNCGKEINLSEWQIEDGAGNQTNLTGSLGTTSNNFIIIEKPKGNLDNKGDIVILHYGELAIDQVTYGNWDDGNLSDNAPMASDPNSLIRKQDALDTNNDNLDWAITSTPTKNKPNILTDPIVEQKSPYANQIIINELLPAPIGNEDNEFIELKNISDRLIDLTGWQISDNSAKKYTINNQDWPNTQIPSGGFFILTRKITRLALNNTGGEIVELFAPDGLVTASAKYNGVALLNQSYSRTEAGLWHWSLTITSGQENIITTPNEPPQAVINAPSEGLVGEIINFDGSDSFDPNHEPIKYEWDFGDQDAASDQVQPIYLYPAAGDYQITLIAADGQGATDTAETRIKIIEQKEIIKPAPISQVADKKPAVKTTGQNYNPTKIVELEKVREYNLGEKVTVKGLVAVEPNILGKTIFYLAGSGVQIYSYYQDWPELKLGDYLQINGALSEAGGETRIKTASRNDIIILEHREPPQPHETAIADLNEDTEGWLVRVQGEITEIQGDNVYLDDGEAEIKAYIKDTTGIDQSKLAEGQKAKITGLVSQTSSGYRLLPRYPSDIEIVAKPSPATSAISRSASNWRDRLFNYLTATAIALAIIIAGLLIKNKKLAKSVNSSQI